MKAAALLVLSLAASPSDGVSFTARSVNVAEPGTPVKISISRWSTGDERAPIVAALRPRAAPPADVAAAPPSGLPAGAASGRGTAPSGLPAEAARGRGAAAAGRGRGRGRGPAAPVSPIEAFTAALGRAPTLGYIWTSDITGYAIKYAWHTTLADGTDRIILTSDRRLGAYTNAWKTAAPAPETDYSFTLIELRTGPKGTLDGRTSLTSKIAIDDDAKTVALASWDTGTSILQIARR
jgi:hypothetical protein